MRHATWLAASMIVFNATPGAARVLRIVPGENALGIAQDAVRNDPSISAVILGTGRYPIVTPIAISAFGHPIVWRSARKGGAVLDGGGQTATAITVSGSQITISGLEIRNFTQNGIVLENADHVSILGNHIADITSTAWSQGAIRGYFHVTDILVADNLIEHTGYAGIMFETNAGGDLSRLKILRNRVIDTCRTKADCGAIYVNGRSHHNDGTVIDGNVVRDFGPPANATKGIYLDDGMSDAIVQRNDVSGTGSYAIQIHGGSNNLIEANRFAPTGGFMLYQSADGNPPMHGNIIRRNRLTKKDTLYAGAGTDRPDLTENEMVR